MPKKVTEQDKSNILKSFIDGINIKELSEMYGFSVTTITRQLKNKLSNEKFKKIRNINSKEISSKQIPVNFKKESKVEKINKTKDDNINFENEGISNNFFEIAPLNYEVDLDNQKDLASIPLDEVDFPKLIYMIVDSKIELIIKMLKDYPEWEFLPEDDLNRKTIEIYYDLKNAKRNCGRDQKVIKVPNTNVFKIVSPILLSRGISRILAGDKLISI
ncbi:hypothetical protein [Prochlorococcus marinus]|uniref:Uncharacterized protein n=1 Tax=Prochlorococcus marinus str. GP2 TaxID=59925 RepID=A0A0A1ZE09_PROMR|nr:hypothetical protein [Prochlorococcus marinus]KGF86503.1 hypothetical protein EU91_1265 [Prochlorococcus marinus str. GP2]